jgi:hypothetical protein
MPTFAAGHSADLINATASLQIGQQDPPTPPQSRRNSIPRVSPLTKLTRSKGTQIDQQPACRRQIPIDREDPNTEPEPARGFLP